MLLGGDEKAKEKKSKFSAKHFPIACFFVSAFVQLMAPDLFAVSALFLPFSIDSMAMHAQLISAFINLHKLLSLTNELIA